MANSRGMLEQCQSRISLDGLPMLDLIHVPEPVVAEFRTLETFGHLKEKKLYI